MNQLTSLFLNIVCAFFILPAVAQEKYRVIPWNAEDGISPGHVYTIFRDSHGFLWIGTNSALNRFDGKRFMQYRPDKTLKGTINSGSIAAIVEDSLHNIWVGTSLGLSRYNSSVDTFTNITQATNAAITNSFIVPFHATSNEVFCIEKGRQITAYNIRTLKKRTLVSSFQNAFANNPYLNSQSFFDKRTNSIWMEAPDGVQEISFTSGRQFKYPLPCIRKEKPKGYDHHVTGISFDTARKVIWLNSSDGLVQFDPVHRRFKHLSAFEKISKQQFYFPSGGIAVDTKQNVWIATTKGFFIYDPFRHSVQAFSPDAPMENEVYVGWKSLYPDQQGIIWTGNWNKHSLYQLTPVLGSLTRYVNDSSDPTGLSDRFVSSMVRGPNGKVWVGSWKGLEILDPSTGDFEMLHEKDLPGLKGKVIIPVVIDSSGQKAWIKTGLPDAMYVMRISTRQCTPISIYDTTAEKKLNWGIRAEQVLPFKNGVLFPIPGAGIFEVKPNSLLAYPVIPIEQAVTRMLVAEDRYLFLRMRDGTPQLSYIYQNKQWNQLHHPFDSLDWHSMYQNSHDGTYWVGTLNEIIHYNNLFKVIRRYTFSNEMTGMDVLSILVDGFGDVWFTNARRSIVRLQPQSGTFYVLSEKDGYKKQKFRWENAVLKDVNGDLYFAGSDGIDRLNPRKFHYTFPPASCYIKAVWVNQQRLTFADGPYGWNKLQLDHNQNSIHLDIGVVDYFSDGNNRVRYRWEGSHKDWEYATAGSVLRFEGLSPGNYKLVLQAANAAGKFNGTEKTLHLSILPPFSNSWWFRSLVLLFIIATIYGIVRWRVHQKFKIRLALSEKEKQLAELRQKTIELEMQALRAQMNPHFIFNCLNSINRFILQNNRQQASEYLTKFSRLVRMILQNSQASLVTLENDLECLDLYLELEALRFDHHFDYRISVPNDMDIAILKLPPLILQPFAENAIWHGLMHKEEKGQLEIDIWEKGGWLYFKLTDNGIGRKQAAERKSKSATKYKSMGLEITAQRIAMLQGTNGKESPVTINDLVEPDGTQAGTEIIIKMPVIYA